jgi:DNA invertase Pin-like site-specific DNA recombinase
MGNERVDTSTATGKLILNMMVSVAQFEREMMKERQVEGIKRAQAEGEYQRPCSKPTRLRLWSLLVLIG